MQYRPLTHLEHLCNRAYTFETNIQHANIGGRKCNYHFFTNLTISLYKLERVWWIINDKSQTVVTFQQHHVLGRQPYGNSATDFTLDSGKLIIQEKIPSDNTLVGRVKELSKVILVQKHLPQQTKQYRENLYQKTAAQTYIASAAIANCAAVSLLRVQEEGRRRHPHGLTWW